jgi:hypothetical protein
VADRDYRPDDPVVSRAVDSLRAFPPVEAEALARTVATAARLRAKDAAPNEDDLAIVGPPRRPSRRLMSLGAAAAVLLAAGIGSLLLSGRASGGRRPTVATVASSPSASTPAVPAAAAADLYETAPIPTQFVYDGAAQHVALVGDFNGWDERATPLVREPGSSLWSATVPLQRGRHVYAFIVDSTWTTDRRAPVSRDPDFGVEGSVIIVGRP